MHRTTPHISFIMPPFLCIARRLASLLFSLCPCCHANSGRVGCGLAEGVWCQQRAASEEYGAGRRKGRIRKASQHQLLPRTRTRRTTRTCCTRQGGRERGERTVAARSALWRGKALEECGRADSGLETPPQFSAHSRAAPCVFCFCLN